MRDRMRVAYLSADFRDHPVAFLMARLFETHDRRRFEPFAISFRRDTGDAMERRIGAAFGSVVDASGMSDNDVAAKMRELRIDIAVDLMGFTTGNRSGILARRPAPIQVNYLGFPATMGAGFIDYISPTSTSYRREARGITPRTSLGSPDASRPNDDTTAAAQRQPTRAQAGLPEAGFVFCSFNKPYKINPALFDLWMRLLEKLPAACSGSMQTMKSCGAISGPRRSSGASRPDASSSRRASLPGPPGATRACRPFPRYRSVQCGGHVQ